MSKNYGSSGPQIAVPPLTPAVKWIMIVTVGAWILLQIMAEGFGGVPVMRYLGLYPGKVVENFFVWQIFSYMFLHSMSVAHILFNMLGLWFIGGELEQRWGAKFFTTYYLCSGAGAALFYCLGVAIYTMVTGNQVPLYIPVVGASGAVFGLLLAFGILFGERTMHFAFMFPMRAKHFVMLLAGIEMVTMLSTGVTGGEVANLAHLGGFLAGYLTLLSYTKWQRLQWNNKNKKKGRNLRLVVDNENEKSKTGEGPKYWN